MLCYPSFLALLRSVLLVKAMLANLLFILDRAAFNMPFRFFISVRPSGVKEEETILIAIRGRLFVVIFFFQVYSYVCTYIGVLFKEMTLVPLRQFINTKSITYNFQINPKKREKDATSYYKN